MKRYFLITILLYWTGLALATISVQVEPSTVSLGEAFRLILTVENPKSGGIPNLIPLEENFTIVGTERSMLYSVINGQTHAVNQWTVMLTAKKTGVLPIPAIQIGYQQSTLSSIEVTGNQAVSKTEDLGGAPLDEVMLKTDVSQHNVYVNQQVIYTVKLYNSQRLLEAEYKPPTVEDALLVPLGEGRRYQTTLNERTYAVEEQQYAIFPQKSGELKITPPSFKALVFDAVPRRLNIHPKITSVVVKPVPANFLGKDWLPASQVALTETYDKTSTTMKQGSTLVRTVTIQAAGVPAQLLPTYSPVSSPQYNAYAEKPELQNTVREQELIGRADIKVTYLLNKAGSITIPSFSLPWFNTRTGKEEVFTLPAHTIQVAATPSSGTQQSVPAPPSIIKKTPIAQPTTQAPRLTEKYHRLVSWLVGGIVLLGFVMIVFWRFCNRAPGNKGRIRLALDVLHNACVTNDPHQAQLALLHWAALQWPEAELLNLHHLTKLTHDVALKKQLSLLSQVLYSQDPSIQWQGDALWRSVHAFLHSKPKVKSKRSELPPINP